jgi:XPG I-region
MSRYGHFKCKCGKRAPLPLYEHSIIAYVVYLHSPHTAVFVFDGPRKPPFNRNERKGLIPDTLETLTIKVLTRAFGFRVWTAPGEAKAECVLLQQRGRVDLVLSEDVDNSMFGAGRVAREVPGKDRNAVMVYEALEGAGLDRDGLVLVAMMSNGDYLPLGPFGFGPKVAAEVPSHTHLLANGGRSCDRGLPIRLRPMQRIRRKRKK